jgi:hypothetical protein
MHRNMHGSRIQIAPKSQGLGYGWSRPLKGFANPSLSSVRVISVSKNGASHANIGGALLNGRFKIA